MSNAISTSTLITARDNLLTAYTQLCTSGIKSYSLGDRTVNYEDRGDLLNEIKELDKMIAMRSTNVGTRAKGRNRANFKSWN